MVEAAFFEFDQHRKLDQAATAKAEIPAPLKWGAAIFAGFITVGSMGFLFWMVSTISETQLTVTQIATRQEMTAEQWEAKFKGLEDRMERLEQQQRVRITP